MELRDSVSEISFVIRGKMLVSVWRRTGRRIDSFTVSFMEGSD